MWVLKQVGFCVEAVCDIFLSVKSQTIPLSQPLSPSDFETLFSHVKRGGGG